MLEIIKLSTPASTIINTSYQKLPFGSGDYPDQLLYHQALNEVSNSSDRELPRGMFRFKTVYNYLGNIVHHQHEKVTFGNSC